MRILVVLPLYGGSLPIGRYCAAALTGLGHLVEIFEAPNFYAGYAALKTLRVTSDRLQYLQNAYLSVVAQAVLAKVETFEPDLVLALAQAPLTLQALKRLRRGGVPTAMWFVEDYRLFTYWQAFAPYYDVFAVIQKGEFPAALDALGVKNHLYLPLAAQPDVHKPLELSSAERRAFGADVSFMGAGYPNRRLAFRELARFDFKLWGSDWDGDDALAPYLQRRGERIGTEDCVRIFNATKINVNLHSSMEVGELVSNGDFVNPRTFEIAACGAFQLVDRRSLMPELFAADELATFSDMPGLVAGVEHFLAHPEERAAFAERGRRRVLREHTYAARMKTLLGFIAERLPGWPRRRAAAPAVDGVPPEYAERIAELLRRLQLPADCSFDDLVWAVRRQQGELGELDAAVLFLDEWRKFYSRPRR